MHVKFVFINPTPESMNHGAVTYHVEKMYKVEACLNIHSLEVKEPSVWNGIFSFSATSSALIFYQNGRSLSLSRPKKTPGLERHGQPASNSQHRIHQHCWIGVSLLFPTRGCSPGTKELALSCMSLVTSHNFSL